VPDRRLVVCNIAVADTREARTIMAGPSAAASRNILVLGASGMLGHALMHELTAAGHDVRGTVRSEHGLPPTFATRFGEHLLTGVDVRDRDHLSRVFDEVGPELVINAVGVIKQAPSVEDRAVTAEVNGLLPHVLAAQSTRVGARLVQVSTDCVFSGRQGDYTEDDVPDPVDFYGRSKLLGEVESPHLTLRTSIIGPELRQCASLVEWFLSQSGQTIKGYTRAIYSGLPTAELARVITDVVIPSPDLSGLWHVASAPISKHDLLGLIAEEYGWQGEIVADDALQIDRSMSAQRFADTTGYAAPAWPELVRNMHEAHLRWTT
jgi:dTDP-4-dehydrorhamnose reductase